MFSLISVICFPGLTGCRSNEAKEAQASQQSRQIFAIDSEIAAIRRELREPLRDVTSELSEAKAEEIRLDQAISAEESNLKKMLGQQKASLAKFDDYRKQYVLENQ
jgi:F0F1-type ATP synthase membrane subunit b/b'